MFLGVTADAQTQDGPLAAGQIEAAGARAQSGNAERPVSSVNSEDTGSVEGWVSDFQEAFYFESARVEIVELGLRTATDRSGAYRFPSVPPGSYTISVDYLGADVVTQTVVVAANQTAVLNFAIGEDVGAVENILITGKRAQTLGALNRERNADNIVSVLDADAMGNFPDKNVAEAARRLPGIAVFNSFGEGDALIVRGLAFDLNRVTLNGLNLGSDNAGERSIGLTILAPELTSGLVVTKSSTPDMDHTGLGGSVDIETLSAFDRSDTMLQIRGGGSHQGITSKNSPEGGGRFSSVFDLGDAGELGVAFVVSWNKRNYGAFPIGFGDGSGGIAGLGVGTQPYALFTNPDGSQAFVPTESLFFRREAVRERLGASASVGWKPKDDLTLTYNFLTTDFRNDLDDAFTLFTLTSGDPNDDVVVSATDTLAAFNAISETKFGSLVDIDTNLYFHIGEFEYFVGSWQIEASIGHSATKRNVTIYEALFGNTGFADTSGTVANSNGNFVDFQYNDPNAKNNGAAYDLIETFQGLSTNEDKELAFRFDITQQRSFFGRNGYLKFGGQGRLRDQAGTFDGTIGFIEATLDQFALSDAGFSDIYDAGVMPDARALRELQFSDPDAFGPFGFSNPVDDFEEDIWAGYVMATVDLLPELTVLGGVRFERTSYAGMSRRTEIFEDVNGAELARSSEVITTSNSYTNVFFDVNLRYNVQDNLIARAAFTQTVKRPSFGSLAGAQTTMFTVPVGAEPTVANAVRRDYSGGNPELDPLESNNFDLSLAYYPDQDSVIQVGLFYKDVSNFETDFSASSPDGTLNIDAPGFGQLTNFTSAAFPVNGRSGNIKGIEFNVVKNFTELPAPWDGLVATANLSLIDSKAELDVDGERIEGAFPFQVSTIYNVSVGYEKHGISSRLSWSDIGESVEQFNLSGSGDRTSAGLRSLDLSVSYAFSDRVSVNFEASNLTNEEEFFFIGERSRPWGFEEFGRTFGISLVVNAL
ncbi:MAG: TonB-dependent receptor [Sphingomonadales bacterium]|nr:TonB-dependent receptor [Sphingomonadales bacterium]